MIAKIWCKLFGHKKPWLFSRDGMRCICARCGYKNISIKGLREVFENPHPLAKLRSLQGPFEWLT